MPPLFPFPNAFNYTKTLIPIFHPNRKRSLSKQWTAGVFSLNPPAPSSLYKEKRQQGFDKHKNL